MSQEQRKNIRLPVPLSQQKGELRFGKQHFPIVVSDLSAEGFAVMSYESPSVDIGSKGLLRAGTEWYEVYLCNSTLLTIPISEDGRDHETSDQPVQEEHYFRIGLRRIGDTYDPDAKDSRWSWPVFSFGYRAPSGMKTFGFGLLFAFLVTLVPFIAVFVIYNAHKNPESNTNQDINSNAGRQSNRVSVDDLSKIHSPNLTTKDETVLPDISYTTSGGIISAPSDYMEELRKMISRMPGASVFMMPNVIQQLQLSPDQQKQIQDILDFTTESFTEIDKRLVHESEQVHESFYQELYSISRSRALKVLNEEQLELWKKLTAENSRNGESGSNANGK